MSQTKFLNTVTYYHYHLILGVQSSYWNHCFVYWVEAAIWNLLEVDDYRNQMFPCISNIRHGVCILYLGTAKWNPKRNVTWWEPNSSSKNEIWAWNRPMFVMLNTAFLRFRKGCFLIIRVTLIYLSAVSKLEIHFRWIKYYYLYPSISNHGNRRTRNNLISQIYIVWNINGCSHLIFF